MRVERGSKYLKNDAGEVVVIWCPSCGMHRPVAEFGKWKHYCKKHTCQMTSRMYLKHRDSSLERDLQRRVEIRVAERAEAINSLVYKPCRVPGCTGDKVHLHHVNGFIKENEISNIVHSLASAMTAANRIRYAMQLTLEMGKVISLCDSHHGMMYRNSEKDDLKLVELGCDMTPLKGIVTVEQLLLLMEAQDELMQDSE